MWLKQSSLGLICSLSNYLSSSLRGWCRPGLERGDMAMANNVARPTYRGEGNLSLGPGGQMSP